MRGLRSTAYGFRVYEPDHYRTVPGHGMVEGRCLVPADGAMGTGKSVPRGNRKGLFRRLFGLAPGNEFGFVKPFGFCKGRIFEILNSEDVRKNLCKVCNLPPERMRLICYWDFF